MKTESDSDMNAGASTSKALNNHKDPIVVTDSSTDLESLASEVATNLRGENELVDPSSPKKSETKKTNKTFTKKPESLPELKSEYSDTSVYRKDNEGLLPSSAMSADSDVILVESEGKRNGKAVGKPNGISDPERNINGENKPTVNGVSISNS